MYCLYTTDSTGTDIVATGRTMHAAINAADEAVSEWDGVMLGKLVDGVIIPVEVE